MTEALYLVAHVAGRGVAIATDNVDSVVDIEAIVPVPRSGESILGIAALRSRVVTVVDTWAALGLPVPASRPRRAVITRVEGHDYAFLVDSVEDVAPLESQALTEGLALGRGWSRAARGIVERDGEPLLVADLAALVPTPA